MNDKRKKLYQGLVDEGLYSKSYEEFENQFSDPESRRKLYSGLVDDNLYSKEYEDFEVQFFSDLQKKNPDGTSSTESSIESPAGSPQADAPTAAGSSSPFLYAGQQQLSEQVQEGIDAQPDQPEGKERNPISSLFKSAWNYVETRLPAALASAAAAFTETDEATLEYYRNNQIFIDDGRSSEQWAKETSKELKEQKKDLLKWKLGHEERNAAKSKELIQSWQEVNDWVDALNYATVAFGESVPQILTTLGTFGASALGEATGNIYSEQVLRTAEKYDITPEEVIELDLDEPGIAQAFGFASMALEKIGADIAIGKMTKSALGESLRNRLMSVSGAVPGGIKAVANFGAKTTGEGLTEVAQGLVEEGGSALGSGTKFEKSASESLDEFLKGAVGSAPIAATTTVAEFNKARKEKAEEPPQPGSEPTTEPPTADTEPTEPPALQQVIEAKKKVDGNKLELGAEVEYQGKKMKVVDEQMREDETVETVTLQDEEGNEVDVAPDQFYAETNKELAGVDPETLKVVDMIEREQAKTAAPQEPGEVKVYNEENIDQIATDNPEVPFLEPLVNAFKSVESVKSVTIHPTDESFQAAVGGIGAGAFKGGEAHINAQRINSTTGLHEVVTPIAAKLATTNPDLLNNFYDQIRNSDAYEGLKDFEALYEDDVKKEEVVTEYLARVASGQIDVTPTVLEQIKAFIQSILDKVGINVFDINLNDETDIRFFAGKLADSLKTGGKIDLDQMDVNDDVKMQRTSPDAVKAKDVLKQAFDNGAINPQNRDQVLNYVAQGFNLQRGDVDLLMKRIESGPRYVRAPRAIRNSRQMEKLSAFHSKYLSGKRGVPAKVQQLREQRSGSIVARVEAASNRAKKLGKMAKESEYTEIDKLMRGQTTYTQSPLRKEVKDLVVEMRQDVDNLSQTLLDEGYIEQRVLGTRTVAGVKQQIANLEAMVKKLKSKPNPTDTDKRRAGLYKKRSKDLQFKLDDIKRQRDNIEANLGTYLTRAYEIYDNENWEPSQQVYEAAIQFTMTEKNMTYDEAKNLTDKILKEKKVAFSKKGGGQEGSKDSSILKQREDVPEPIRALYGEYTDPLQAYAETVFRLSSYIENARFLNDFREIGLGFFVFEDSDPSKPPHTELTKISAKGDERMAPLDGLYTYDGIYEALGGGDGAVRFTGPWAWINWFNAAINWSKTVGSYQTHARNVIGNIPFMLGNGYFLSIDPRTWGNPTKAIAKAFKAVGRDAAGRYGTKGDKYDSLLERLKQNGVIGQNLTTNMIDDILSSDDIPERLYRRRYNKRRGIFQKGKRMGKNVIEVLNTAYGAEDDFFKVTAYILEADQRARAYFNKPYDQLTADERSEVDEEAMEIVKNVLPNYGRIGTAIRTLSTFPLVGNFVSFASEAMRVSYNTADLAIAELRSSNPKIRAIGGRRIVNQMLYASFKASLIKGIAAAIGATTEYVFHTAPHEMFGLGDDEDKEEERAVREFMWEWVKNNDLAVLSIDKGVIRVQDISATDPHGNIVRTKNAIRMAQDKTKIPQVIAEEVLLPFFDQSILMQYLEAIKDGTDTYDKQLTRSTAPAYEKAEDAAMFTIRTIGPTSINSAMKLVEGKGTLLGQMFGNTYEIDINKTFRYKIADYTSYKSGGDEEGIREKASEIFNSDRTDEEKQAWLDQLNKEREGSLNKLKVAYQRALLLKADPHTLREMIRKALDENEERYVLYDSPYRPLTRNDIKIYDK